MAEKKTLEIWAGVNYRRLRSRLTHTCVATSAPLIVSRIEPTGTCAREDLITIAISSGWPAVPPPVGTNFFTTKPMGLGNTWSDD